MRVDLGHHGIKVLLIDPNEEDRQYWAHRLRMASDEYVVLEASSGAAGLQLCQVEQFDCVVTELELPDMSGFQVLLTLVPLTQHPEVAVIVLTRLFPLTHKDLALKNGAQAFLFKSRSSGDDLDFAIMRAIAAVGRTTKNHKATQTERWKEDQ